MELHCNFCILYNYGIAMVCKHCVVNMCLMSFAYKNVLRNIITCCFHVATTYVTFKIV